jgi:8-oxo-dGTP pyrophosphatase MutT (NUDIX family)
VTTLPGWLQTLADALPHVRPEQLSRFLPPVDGGGRHAAVLVLFGEAEQGPEVLLIERAATMRSHAGQPAFPGGAVDDADGPVDDGGHVRAALREAQEEVGLDPATVEVLGAIPALWLPPSGFVVHPVLAWWRAPHEVHAVDAAEVAAVARVPIAELVDPENRLQVTHPSGWIGPAFEVSSPAGELLVWGFTAGLLSRLLALGGWERPWDTERTRELDPAVLALALRSTPASLPPQAVPLAAPPDPYDAVPYSADDDAEATGAG